MPLIFVDTEDANPTPTGWSLREFGAVKFKSRRTFHGKDSSRKTFEGFKTWLESFGRSARSSCRTTRRTTGRPSTSTSTATSGENPFGHSARRIGDFYAGLVGDFGRASEWKRLRITEHDHHPVHDAMGNVEAFARILAERACQAGEGEALRPLPVSGAPPGRVIRPPKRHRVR